MTILTGYNENIGEFRLVPLEEDSAEDYALFLTLFKDPEIMKTCSLFGRQVPTDEEARAFYSRISRTHKTDDIGDYKILDSREEFLGIAGLIEVERNKEGKISVVDIGYFIRKKFWNKKISTDTTKVLIRYAFIQLTCIESIVGTVLFDNYVSYSILFNSGFSFAEKSNCDKYYNINSNFLLAKETFEKTYSSTDNKICGNFSDHNKPILV